MSFEQKTIRMAAIALILVAYGNFLMAEALFVYISSEDAKTLGAFGSFMDELNIGYLQHGLIFLTMCGLIYMIWPVDVKRGRIRFASV